MCKNVQWLGSYCDQHAEKCCYPPSGKPPADFSIEGLWPYFNDGSFPYNCGGGNFNEALVCFFTLFPSAFCFS